MSRFLKQYILNWHTSPWIACQSDQSALSVTHFWASDRYRKVGKGCKLHLRNLRTPEPIYDRNCSLAEGEWNVFQRGVVCLSICLLVFQAPILWCVGEADTDMVSLGLAKPGPAADSGFYLMWTSRVGFQSWFQHMISIMTRGGTYTGGWLVTLGRQEGE